MEDRVFVGRRSLTVLSVIAVSLWLAHSGLHFQRKIPQGDEFDMLLSHEALFSTGEAVFRMDGLAPVRSANWHPPLWWLVTNSIMRLGFGALHSVLALNLVCGFVTIGATWMLGYRMAQLANYQTPSQLAALSVIVLCTIPLFQTASGIIDIDNGLLTAVMTLYLALLWGTDAQTWIARILLGVILGLTLLTKISTPLILVPLTLLFFAYRQKNIPKAIISTGMVVVIGGIVFAAIFAITRPLFPGHWDQPFVHNFSLLITRSSGANWLNRFRTLGELLIWIGPPSILFVILILRLAYCHDVTIAGPLLVLAIYVTGIWFAYCYVGVTFNLRYMVPSLPALAVVTAFLFYEGRAGIFADSRGLQEKAKLIGLALVSALAICILPDPYLLVKTRLKSEFWSAGVSYGLELVLVCVGVYILLWRLRSKEFRISNLCLTWLACVWFVFNLNTSFKQMTGKYQLSYAYGFSEYEGVVKWLTEHDQNGVPVFASESFLWLLRGSNLTVYSDKSLDLVTGTNELKRHIASYYLVLPRRYGRGAQQSWVESLVARTDEVYRNSDFAVVKGNL